MASSQTDGAMSTDAAGTMKSQVSSSNIVGTLSELLTNNNDDNVHDSNESNNVTVIEASIDTA